jgi:D-alanyl-D-alanine dipeptidase
MASRRGHAVAAVAAAAFLSAGAGAGPALAASGETTAREEFAGPRAAGLYTGRDAARLRKVGMVPVRTYDASIRTDVVYATDRNFTGERVPGYCAGEAWMRASRARALARVQRSLRPRGLGLLVYDAYRPLRGSRGLVRWAQRTGRQDLLTDGYIAYPSRHNLGSTVDLTLVDLDTGKPLNMGTGYDALTPRAHTRNARGRVLANRLTLVRAMRAQGFTNYAREWWHFDSAVDPGTRRFDIPIGCN